MQCGFGYQYPNIGTGYDVVAIADASPEFAGSCGCVRRLRCSPPAPTPALERMSSLACLRPPERAAPS